MLDLADVIEGDIGRPGFGSEQYLRQRAAGFRRVARELVRGIPDASPSMR
jgi:hypothetical protein